LAHDEHNRSRKGGGFFLIIFGAILLIIAPTIYGDMPNLAVPAFVAGFLVGGIGFYTHFVRNRGKT